MLPGSWKLAVRQPKPERLENTAVDKDCTDLQMKKDIEDPLQPAFADQFVSIGCVRLRLGCLMNERPTFHRPLHQRLRMAGLGQLSPVFVLRWSKAYAVPHGQTSWPLPLTTFPAQPQAHPRRRIRLKRTGIKRRKLLRVEC